MNRLAWGILIAVMTAVVIANAGFFKPQAAIPAALPVLGEAPSFQLTDSSGGRFDSKSLEGKVWLADFIFTSCAGSCPQLTGEMAKIQKKLGKEIRLVSISVDPRRDSPKALASYAARYGADLARWSFLTGEPSAVERLVQKGFRLALSDGNGSEKEPIIHSTRILLIDRQGKIRGGYQGDDPQALSRLLSDSRDLARNSR